MLTPSFRSVWTAVRSNEPFRPGAICTAQRRGSAGALLSAVASVPRAASVLSNRASVLPNCRAVDHEARGTCCGTAESTDDEVAACPIAVAHAEVSKLPGSSVSRSTGRRVEPAGPNCDTPLGPDACTATRNRTESLTRAIALADASDCAFTAQRSPAMCSSHSFSACQSAGDVRPSVGRTATNSIFCLAANARVVSNVRTADVEDPSCSTSSRSAFSPSLCTLFHTPRSKETSRLCTTCTAHNEEARSSPVPWSAAAAASAMRGRTAKSRKVAQTTAPARKLLARVEEREALGPTRHAFVGAAPTMAPV